MYTFKTKEELETLVEDARTSAAFSPSSGICPVPVAVGVDLIHAMEIRKFFKDLLEGGEFGKCEAVIYPSDLSCCVYLEVHLKEEDRRTLLEQEDYMDKAIKSMSEDTFLMRDLLAYDELLSEYTWENGEEEDDNING